MTILLRASNITLPEAPTEKCFPDVDTTLWYHRYICAAHTLGIANGFSDGKFRPNAPVTTLEAIAFGNKAFSLGINTMGDPWYEALQRFSDDNHIMATHSYTKSTEITR
ncbi:S-layer homology domain-containing protein [Candidatus Peribacteria bacterium]|nr:S-layer homology domain-containing protein [Candidatus Peribacteria bacterium]